MQNSILTDYSTHQINHNFNLEDKIHINCYFAQQKWPENITYTLIDWIYLGNFTPKYFELLEISFELV